MSEKWLGPAEAEAWRAYLVSSQLLFRELDRQLQRDSGLTHSQYGILVQLADRPDFSARITALAELMDHSQSRMSHAISRLERDGLVRRDLDSSDGRVVHAVLTDAGRAALTAAAPGHVASVRANLFDGLSAEQVEQLTAICEVMLGRLTAGRWPGRPAAAP